MVIIISSFSEFIKQTRKENKLSLKDVAEKSGVSHAYISQIENGKRGIPKPKTLEKIAVGLGVQLTELLEAAGYVDDWFEVFDYVKVDDPLYKKIYKNILIELENEGIDTRYEENRNLAEGLARKRYEEIKQESSKLSSIERSHQHPLDLREILNNEPAMIINKEKIKFQLLYADQELSEEDKQFLLQVMDRTMRPRDKEE